MKLAIFDFDLTLLKVDTLPFLLSNWKKHNYSKTRYYQVVSTIGMLYVKYKTGMTTMSRSEMKVKAVDKFNKLFKNMSREEVLEYFSKCAEEAEALYNLEVLNELEQAKKNGYHTVILSGAYDTLLKPIGDFLGVDTVVGTEVVFTNQLFDHEKSGEVLNGERKLAKIKELFNEEDIEWEESIFYTDGYSDISLLEAVGNPVVVNPDKDLHKIALEKGWRFLA